MKIFVRMILLVSLLVPTCLARDIHVSNCRGDDRNTGHKLSNDSTMVGPVRTIQRALQLARPGDSIVLEASELPYHESVMIGGLAMSGGSEMPIIIEGNGAILDGRAELPGGIWQPVTDDIYRFPLNLFQPIDMTCFHISDQNISLKKIVLEPNDLIHEKLEPNSWCIRDGFLYFCAEEKTSPLMGDYQLLYSKKMVGITLMQVKNFRIHDLTVQGFQLDGISAVSLAENIILDGVESLLNGRTGLKVATSSSMAVGYSRFENNLSDQVQVHPAGKVEFYKCNILENGIKTVSAADMSAPSVIVSQ